VHDEACHRVSQPGASTAEGGPFDSTRQAMDAILAGDFNFPPDHPAYAEIQATGPSDCPPYRDSWAIANGRRPHVPTFCVHDQRYSKEPYCCDFIFVSETLASRVHAVRVDSDTRASDHQPVLLEMDDR
jgi:endonuclease/exonuclease/phosphatase family metal-dependent hydrolase